MYVKHIFDAYIAYCSCLRCSLLWDVAPCFLFQVLMSVVCVCVCVCVCVKYVYVCKICKLCNWEVRGTVLYSIIEYDTSSSSSSSSSSSFSSSS